jgi:iron-sulfur cluster assembly accessory protein
MDTTKRPPFTFSDKAFRQIMQLKEQLLISENQYLRVGIKGGGCAGVSYLLAFDFKEEDDTVYEYLGLSFLVKKSHGMHVVGMHIDYDETQGGFEFQSV